jgi:hypothetical protein
MVLVVLPHGILTKEFASRIVHSPPVATLPGRRTGKTPGIFQGFAKLMRLTRYPFGMLFTPVVSARCAFMEAVSFAFSAYHKNLLLLSRLPFGSLVSLRFTSFGLDSANFYERVVSVRRRLFSVAGGKVVNSMRTYLVRVFQPTEVGIEAENEEHALEKVAELYKALYRKDIRSWIEPLPEPEDTR